MYLHCRITILHVHLGYPKYLSIFGTLSLTLNQIYLVSLSLKNFLSEKNSGLRALSLLRVGFLIFMTAVFFLPYRLT